MSNDVGSGRYKNVMMRCERVIDYQAENALGKTTRMNLRLDTGDFTDDKNRTIFIKPIVKRWSTVLVNESPGVYYIGLNTDDMFHIELESLYDISDFRKYYADKDYAMMYICMKFFTGAAQPGGVLGAENNSYSIEEAEKSYNTLKEYLDGLEKDLKDRIRYYIKNGKDYLGLERLSRGRKYIPIMSIDFNAKEYYLYCNGMGSKQGVVKYEMNLINDISAIESSVSNIFKQNFYSGLRLRFLKYTIDGINDLSV